MDHKYAATDSVQEAVNVEQRGSDLRLPSLVACRVSRVLHTVALGSTSEGLSGVRYPTITSNSRSFRMNTQYENLIPKPKQRRCNAGCPRVGMGLWLPRAATTPALIGTPLGFHNQMQSGHSCEPVVRVDRVALGAVLLEIPWSEDRSESSTGTHRATQACDFCHCVMLLR